LTAAVSSSYAMLDAAACKDCVAVQGGVYGCDGGLTNDMCQCGADACDHGVQFEWECTSSRAHPMVYAAGVVGLLLLCCVR